MSDISFAGLGAALGALAMLLIAAVGVVVECVLASRSTHRRWRVRLAGPALFAVVALAILAAANSAPAELRQGIDRWFVPVVLVAVLVWLVVRSWRRGEPRRRQ